MQWVCTVHLEVFKTKIAYNRKLTWKCNRSRCLVLMWVINSVCVKQFLLDKGVIFLIVSFWPVAINIYISYAQALTVALC